MSNAQKVTHRRMNHHVSPHRSLFTTLIAERCFSLDSTRWPIIASHYTFATCILHHSCGVLSARAIYYEETHVIPILTLRPPRRHCHADSEPPRPLERPGRHPARGAV